MRLALEIFQGAFGFIAGSFCFVVRVRRLTDHRHHSEFPSDSRHWSSVLCVYDKTTRNGEDASEEVKRDGCSLHLCTIAAS